MDRGNISTNIRLGRLDYIIRYKNKKDPTNWKEIPPMNIPTNVDEPEIDDKYFNDLDINEVDDEEQRDEEPASRKQLDLPPIMIINDNYRR